MLTVQSTVPKLNVIELLPVVTTMQRPDLVVKYFSILVLCPEVQMIGDIMVKVNQVFEWHVLEDSISLVFKQLMVTNIFMVATAALSAGVK
jgi:small basic protein